MSFSLGCSLAIHLEILFGHNSLIPSPRASWVHGLHYRQGLARVSSSVSSEVEIRRFIDDGSDTPDSSYYARLVLLPIRNEQVVSVDAKTTIGALKAQFGGQNQGGNSAPGAVGILIRSRMD